MSTLYEYYNTGDDGAVVSFGSRWSAQTFTPAIAHKITSVKLLLYRTGSPGTITVSIRATDADGKPTGADLCSGITDGDTLTTDPSGEWREITLGDGYNLDADVRYAIVVRAPSSNPSNYFRWRMDTTSPSYADGSYSASKNSGSTWTLDTAKDTMFEDWGEPLPIALSGVSAGVCTVSGLLAVAHSLAGVSAGV